MSERHHNHETDARGDLAIADDLERFFVDVGLPPKVIADFRRRWSRRIIERPLRVRRCLEEAILFHQEGGRPRKTWGHYLDYRYQSGLKPDGQPKAPSPNSPAPAATAVRIVEEMTDEDRQRRGAELRATREHIRTHVK